jgi:hypothetical protein
VRREKKGEKTIFVCIKFNSPNTSLRNKNVQLSREFITPNILLFNVVVTAEKNSYQQVPAIRKFISLAVKEKRVETFVLKRGKNTESCV